MESNARLLITKLWNKNRKQTNFLENYYTEKLGHKVSINLGRNYYESSYYNTRTHEISISIRNLHETYERFPNLFYSLFYTIILHEIAHAIYTCDMLSITNVVNILEDNRIEHHTQKWNKRAKFRLLRFALQDLSFRDNQGKIENKTALGLALLRTIDNSMYVSLLANTPKRKKLIDDIIYYDKVYTSKDYMLSKDGSRAYELQDIAQKVSDLLDEFIEDWNQDHEPEKEKKPSKDSTEESSDEPSEPSDEQDEESDEESDDEEDEDDGPPKQTDTGFDPESDQGGASGNSEKNGQGTSNGQGEDEDPLSDKKDDPDEYESLTHKEFQELLDELAELSAKNRQLEEENDNNIGLLYNPNPTDEKYDQVKISAFTTARRVGIKGSRKVTRHTGTVKDLSLKKYARRNHVSHEKMFSKETESLGRGGKTARVLFYLDVSGSMSGKRLYHSVRYLKSFYDQMHKHLEIRFMAFNGETYEFTRNELDYKFMDDVCGGGTSPTAVKLKPKEEIIFVTDGEFYGTRLPDEYMKNAHFVLIDMNPSTYAYHRHLMRNAHFVHTAEIEKGLDNATKGIKQALKRSW